MTESLAHGAAAQASRSLQSLRELRVILVRLGAGPAGRYWSSDGRVFANNFLGGLAAGAVASVLAALVLVLDVHRGPDSFVYHVLDGLAAVVRTVQAQIQQELR